MTRLRYARIRTVARGDAIGRVTAVTADSVVIRVPNWNADGWHVDLRVPLTQIEWSTASACLAAAEQRRR